MEGTVSFLPNPPGVFTDTSCVRVEFLLCLPKSLYVLSGTSEPQVCTSTHTLLHSEAGECALSVELLKVVLLEDSTDKTWEKAVPSPVFHSLQSGAQFIHWVLCLFIHLNGCWVPSTDSRDRDGWCSLSLESILVLETKFNQTTSKNVKEHLRSVLGTKVVYEVGKRRAVSWKARCHGQEKPNASETRSEGTCSQRKREHGDEAGEAGKDLWLIQALIPLKC